MEWGLLSFLSGFGKEYTGENAEVKSIALSYKILSKNTETDPKNLEVIVRNLLHQVEVSQSKLKNENASINVAELKVLTVLNEHLTAQLKKIEEVVKKQKTQDSG